MLNIRLAFLGGRAIYSLVQDANRLDRVFELLDAVSDQPEDLQRMRDLVTRDPELAAAVRTFPRLGRVDLGQLSQLPEGTLGHAFTVFLNKNGLDPNALPVKEAHDTPSYLRAHLSETHDLWHVLTGFGPDAASELGLQAFYLAQAELRPALSLLMTGFISAFFRQFDMHAEMMTQITRGWLLGRRARRLIGTDWKPLMDRPLDEVRAMFGLDLERVDALLRESTPSSPPARMALA